MKNCFRATLFCLFLLQKFLFSYESDMDYRYQESYTFGTFTVGADWLYWKTTQTEFDFGNKITRTGSLSEEYFNSRALKPKFNYSSGFKIYGYYTTNDDSLKFSISYSHIPSHAKKNGDGNLAEIEFDSLFSSDSSILSSSLLFSNFRSKWFSSVNICDLDIEKRFCLCDCIEMMPHLGVRFFGLSQIFKLKSSFDSAFFKSKFRGQISALGIEGGVTGSWQIFEQLSLVAHIGGAVMYAFSHNHARLEAFSFYEGSDEIKHKKEYQFGIPMFDAFIGLTYFNTFFCYDVNFHLGWEEHIIFDTNKLFSHRSGNTNLHGLTLGGEISF